MSNSTLLKKISMAAVGSAVAVTSIAATVNPAQALTLFTDRAAFNAATQSLTNIDFEGIAPSESYTDFGNGLTVSGATFTNNNNYEFVVDPNLYQPFYDWGSGAVLSGYSNGTINVSLGSGVTAVGSDIMSFANYASDFLVTLSTGNSYTLSSSNYANRSFVGFTSDVAISSISFQATNGYTELDNFTFGQAKPTQSVPEPASVLGLLGLGSLGVGSTLKRKLQGKGDN